MHYLSTILMKKNAFILVILCAIGEIVNAQNYFTKAGDVSFYSDAAMEKIEASTDRAAAVLNTETGSVDVAVLVKSFLFEKALMQEHFNENYMESGKYPKAVFKGEIAKDAEIDFMTEGSYDIVVAGDLTMHGVTQAVEIPATVEVKDGVIHAEAMFSVRCQDYDIKIPKLVVDNIAESIDIKVILDLEPM